MLHSCQCVLGHPEHCQVAACKVQQANKSEPATKTYRIDIREIAYHVVDIEARSLAEAKEVFFGSDCPLAEYVDTVEWDAVRVAEVNEDGSDDHVVFEAKDFDRGWSYQP